MNLTNNQTNSPHVFRTLPGAIILWMLTIIVVVSFTAADTVVAQVNETVRPGGGDDTANLNNAIRRILVGGGGQLRLEPNGGNRIFKIRGQSLLSGDAYGYTPALEIRDRVDGTDVGNARVEILGIGGVVLELQNWATAFSIVNHPGRVAIRNLIIRLSRIAPSHVGGDVTADRSDHFLVQLDSAYDGLSQIYSRPLDIVYDYTRGNPGFPSENGNFHRRVDRNERCWQVSNEPKVLRCTKNSNYSLGVGKSVVVTFRKNGHDAIRAIGSGRIEVSGVSVWSAPGMALTVVNSGSVSVTNFNVVPQANRWQSVSAAATHFRSNRGGAWFNQVRFDRFGDDGFNFHNLMLKVDKAYQNSQIPDRYRLRLVRWQSSTAAVPVEEVKPGDNLRIGRLPDPFHTNQTGKVLSVSRDDRAIIAVVSGLNHAVVEGNTVSNLTVNPNVSINNCVVNRNRGRGILISAVNTKVDNCVFVRNSGPSILITSDIGSFGSGRVPQRVSILNSKFYNSNLGATRRWAMLEIGGDLPRPSGSGLDPSSSRFSSIQRVEIRNNVFGGSNRTPRIMAATTNQGAVTLINNEYNYSGGCPVRKRVGSGTPSCY